ncbi:MAG: TonB family protein [Bacteroidetes bacterium]|nr:TonB family protein [Bacteroidota bacterium]MCH8941728.1 TonB family protein [Bacteroidota bacterium]
MNFQSIKNYPLLLSCIIHVIFFLIFLVIKINAYYPSKDFVVVTFGLSGKSGSPGILGADINKSKNLKRGKKIKKSYTVKREEKKIELPRSKASNKINTDKNNPKSGVVLKGKTITNKSVQKGNKGKKNIGKNNLGYDIDWGGRGQRRIYSFSLPEYPAGVNKEIDIRLRFTILSDGTVGSIFPLIKADTRLEDAAIKSLRQWRFEPLAPEQSEVIQTAVINFPYRLK